MSGEFHKLCAEVDRDTSSLRYVEDCFPHYQKVLDYICAHPEERDEMAIALSGSFYGKPGAVRASIHLLLFLMKSLKWPEVKLAAEQRWNDGGNSVPEIKELLKIYE